MSIYDFALLAFFYALARTLFNPIKLAIHFLIGGIMNIFFEKLLQDGNLPPTCGRIVIYNDFIDISRGPSRDHNDLLRSFASKFKLNKDDVISNAIRLYWDYKNKDSIIVSPVRKLDEDMYYANQDFFNKLINSVV